MGNSMIYFMISDSVGHAVNATFYDSTSGNILYNDLQTGGTGVVHISDVISIYKP